MATQKDAMVAYVILCRMGKKVKGKAAHRLFRVKAELKPLIDFRAEQEMAMAERYGAAMTEDGNYLFANKDQQKAFNKERKELDEMEIEPEIKPITMNQDSVPDIDLDEVSALRPFVIFEDEEEKDNGEHDKP